MAGEMFGAPVGISAALADNSAQQLNQLAMAEGVVKLRSAQMLLTQQQKQLQLMNQMNAGQPTGQGGVTGQTSQPGQPGQPGQAAANDPSYDAATLMFKYADIARLTGDMDKSADMMAKGSTLLKNGEEINKSKFEIQMKKLDTFGSLLASAPAGEMGWRQANAMYSLIEHEPSPYAKLPYRPEIVEQLKAGVQTAKDRVMMEAAKAREQASLAEVTERQTRVPLIKAQTEKTLVQADVLKKAGGVAKLPKASEIQVVTDKMADLSEYWNENVKEARVIARPIVDRAKVLVEKNHMDMESALNRAFLEARDAGKIPPARPRRELPGSFKAPVPVPEDPKAREDGKWYIGPTGKTALWQDGKWLTQREAQERALKLSEDGSSTDETPVSRVPADKDDD